MKKHIISVYLLGICLGCAVSGQANAIVTIYQYDQSPDFHVQKANPYASGNLYLKTNNNNPYSGFRNPYSPHSVFNNTSEYGAHTNDSVGEFQGTMSTSSNFHPDSINNPYGAFGNPYNKNNAYHPYNPYNNNNPYSPFRQVYNPHSVFNSKLFHTPYTIPYGNQTTR